jgi:hypothetical protein
MFVKLNYRANGQKNPAKVASRFAALRSCLSVRNGYMGETLYRVERVAQISPQILHILNPYR